MRFVACTHIVHTPKLVPKIFHFPEVERTQSFKQLHPIPIPVPLYRRMIQDIVLMGAIAVLSLFLSSNGMKIYKYDVVLKMEINAT